MFSRCCGVRIANTFSDASRAQTHRPFPRGPQGPVHGGFLSLAQSHPLLLARVLEDVRQLFAEVKVLQGRHLRRRQQGLDLLAHGAG